MPENGKLAEDLIVWRVTITHKMSGNPADMNIFASDAGEKLVALKRMREMDGGSDSEYVRSAYNARTTRFGSQMTLNVLTCLWVYSAAMFVVGLCNEKFPTALILMTGITAVWGAAGWAYYDLCKEERKLRNMIVGGIVRFLKRSGDA